jgi:hypothetical protein
VTLDLLRAGFREYFGGDGPELPDPVPSRGLASGGGWTARYVVHDDAAGHPVLDFLVQHGMQPPVHGRVDADGSAHTIGTFLDHSVFDPNVDGDEDAALARMEAHNQAVTDELRRVGLL